MTGGGGGDDSGMAAMMQHGTPMPGLPIAGQGPGVNAFEYGQFQNFLPDIKAEGPNDMATGLRPDMFKYKSPTGVVAEGSGGGNTDGQIQELRDALAKLTGGGGAAGGGDNSGIMGGGSGNGGFPQYGDPNAAAKFMGGAGGGTLAPDVAQRLAAAGYRGGDNPYVGQTSVSPQGLATSRHYAVGPQFDEAQNTKNIELMAAARALPKV